MNKELGKFSTQLNSTQLNSTQLNSTQLNSTQLKHNYCKFFALLITICLLAIGCSNKDTTGNDSGNSGSSSIDSINTETSGTEANASDLSAYNNKTFSTTSAKATVDGYPEQFKSTMAKTANNLSVGIKDATIFSICTGTSYAQLYKNGDYYEASYSGTYANSGTQKGYIKIKLDANNSITVVDGQYGIDTGTGSRLTIKWTNETLTEAKLTSK